MTPTQQALRLSRKLVHALRLSEIPAYRHALRAGYEPTALSKLVHGARRVRPDDPRLGRLAKGLGLHAEDAVEVGEPAGD